MLGIHHGTWTWRTTVGYVAEFCTQCAAVRRFKLRATKQISHINLIPLGRPRVLGHIAVCEGCRAEFGVRPEKYRAIASSPHLAMNDLVAQTSTPDLMQRAARAAELNHRARSGQLSAAERVEMVSAAILGRGELDWIVGRSFQPDQLCVWLIVLFGAAAIWTVLEFMTPGRLDFWRWVALATACWLLAGFTWAMLTVRRRFVRSSLEPGLTRSLSAVLPSASEIEQGCQAAIRRGFHLASLIQPDRLEGRIRAQNARTAQASPDA